MLLFYRPPDIPQNNLQLNTDRYHLSPSKAESLTATKTFPLVSLRSLLPYEVLAEDE